MAATTIEWADFTFNPWSGCTKVNAGCAHCYAEVNYSVKIRGVKWGPNGNRVKASESMWKQPLKWNRQGLPCTCGADRTGPSAEAHDLNCDARRRPRVFCASLADVFEDWHGPVLDHHGNPGFVLPNGKRVWPIAGTLVEGVDCRPVTLDDLRRDLFALIDATPNLDWLLLTKRPENIRRMWPDSFAVTKQAGESFDSWAARAHDVPTVRPNLWLGCSVSDQATADAVIPELLKCRDLAPVLFVSYEPAMGPVDFSAIGRNSDGWPAINAMTGERRAEQGPTTRVHDGPRLDWIIVGGESGPKARPFDVQWARSTIEQCKASDVACFIKQLGRSAFDSECSDIGQFDGSCGHGMDNGLHYLRLDDKKGGDWSEWPEALKVRQFPPAAECPAPSHDSTARRGS